MPHPCFVLCVTLPLLGQANPISIPVRTGPEQVKVERNVQNSSENTLIGVSPERLESFFSKKDEGQLVAIFCDHWAGEQVPEKDFLMPTLGKPFLRTTVVEDHAKYMRDNKVPMIPGVPWNYYHKEYRLEYRDSETEITCTNGNAYILIKLASGVKAASGYTDLDPRSVWLVRIDLNSDRKVLSLPVRKFDDGILGQNPERCKAEDADWVPGADGSGRILRYVAHAIGNNIWRLSIHSDLKPGEKYGVWCMGKLYGVFTIKNR